MGRLLLGIGVVLGVDQFAAGLALQLSVAGVRGPALSAVFAVIDFTLLTALVPFPKHGW